MSKARLVITAVVVEGRSPGEVARDYGVSKGWVYELIARYRTEGDAAFEPRSRRPHTRPAATAATTVELDPRAPPTTHRGRASTPAPTRSPGTSNTTTSITVSRATIYRILRRAGLVDRRTEEEAEVVLHPLPSRATQRDLAVRLHPLPPRRRHRHRDPHLARRPLPLRPVGHRPPTRHRPDRRHHLPQQRSPNTASRSPP